MKSRMLLWAIAGAVGIAMGSGLAAAQVAKNVAAKSPWGPADEIGTLNMMTEASRFDVLGRIASGKVYDLGVELFVGMPTCCAPFGDPTASGAGAPTGCRRRGRGRRPTRGR